jgi:hypothetical protein
MAVVREIIDLLVCRKIHGCGCVGPSLTWKKYGWLTCRPPVVDVTAHTPTYLLIEYCTLPH